MRVIVIACLALALCSMLAGCGGLRKSGALHGLQPGVNYMQPRKWRMTYYYRVKDIAANVPLRTERPSAIDPDTPAAGRGTWEVWLEGPREGEELRNLKLVSATLEPTKVTKNPDGLSLYYFNLAPDGYLAKEVQFSVTWEFVTFERYTFWDGMKYGDYDKNSDLYKRYTASVSPILKFDQMKLAVKEIMPEDKHDYVKTALNCYNYLLANYQYDNMQEFYTTYTGWSTTHDSFRVWQNRSGVCLEFATELCALLRCAGIPARPVCGMSHHPYTREKLKAELGLAVPDDMLSEDILLIPGPHAWVEFYLPDYGWIPADPTWGQESNTEAIDAELSIVGNLRHISFADYYFGKMDSFRIPLLKNYNIALNPPPKTPGANKDEIAFVYYTERSSGVHEKTHGWEGPKGLASG